MKKILNIKKGYLFLRNAASIEVFRRVKLDDHLNHIGDLRRQIEKTNENYKQEIEVMVTKQQVCSVFFKEKIDIV
jgi:hypothetical protein